jgi:hypothetical protein
MNKLQGRLQTLKGFVAGLLVSVVIGGVAIAAPQSVAPSTHKVKVDGKSVEMSGYAIDGYNYFKLRDVASAVNFGLWFDESASTVMVETDKGYDAGYTGPSANIASTTPTPTPTTTPTTTPKRDPNAKLNTIASSDDFESMWFDDSIGSSFQMYYIADQYTIDDGIALLKTVSADIIIDYAIKLVQKNCGGTTLLSAGFYTKQIANPAYGIIYNLDEVSMFTIIPSETLGKYEIRYAANVAEIFQNCENTELYNIKAR